MAHTLSQHSESPEDCRSIVMLDAVAFRGSHPTWPGDFCAENGLRHIRYLSYFLTVLNAHTSRNITHIRERDKFDQTSIFHFTETVITANTQRRGHDNFYESLVARYSHKDLLGESGGHDSIFNESYEFSLSLHMHIYCISCR